MDNKLKVLITSNIPSPYFVNYCNELNKYVDLTVVFELDKAKDRDDSWYKNNYSFKSIFLGGIKIGNESSLSFKLKKIIQKGNYDRIIIANPLTPTGIVTLLYLKHHKIHHIIQSEGGFQGTGKGIKERFKKYILGNADMYLTGMGGDDDYFFMYGASKDKLRPYHFTSSYSYQIDDKVPTDKEKQDLKDKLGISTKHMILYVGQFIHRKGIDQLLKAFKDFDDNTTLVCIGGAPTQEYKDIINNLNIKNIRFIEFISKEELTNYYRAADLFTLITREDTWGLVINEAMEHGCPIVSTDRSIAARCLVENDINGYLVDFDDMSKISSSIKKILDNNELRNQIAINNLNKIKDHTLENMASTIFDYIG